MPTAGGFYITAVAVMPGVTGGRAFAASQVGSIWENAADGAVAPTEADLLAPPTLTDPSAALSASLATDTS